VNAPNALAVIGGDDVYEDLFTAGRALAGLAVEAGLATRISMGTERLAQLGSMMTGADTGLVLLYTAMGSFSEPAQAALAAAVRAGTGLIAVHSANVFPAPDGAPGTLDPAFRQAYALIGSRYASHGPPPHESRFTVQTDQGHPLTRGLSDFEITHEHYHLELTADVRVVARRGTEAVVHVRQEGRGRVAYVQLGHDMRVWDDPKARALMTRCIGWVLDSQNLGVTP
jgi:type 1 glutamine amidotransferase